MCNMYYLALNTYILYIFSSLIKPHVNCQAPISFFDCVTCLILNLNKLCHINYCLLLKVTFNNKDENRVQYIKDYYILILVYTNFATLHTYIYTLRYMNYSKPIHTYTHSTIIKIK